MQRIIVDLPEPDGPAMTMRSPLLTLRLMSLSTWKSAYHLLTPIMIDGDLVGDLELAGVDGRDRRDVSGERHGVPYRL